MDCNAQLELDKEIDERIADANRRYDLAGQAHLQALRDARERAVFGRYLPSGPYPILFQPFPGAVVLRGGESWWGHFHCCGVFTPTGAEHAQRVAIARAHGDALREDATRMRHLMAVLHAEALVDDARRAGLVESSDSLVAALEASLVTFVLTPRGRAEVQGAA